MSYSVLCHKKVVLVSSRLAVHKKGSQDVIIATDTNSSFRHIRNFYGHHAE